MNLQQSLALILFLAVYLTSAARWVHKGVAALAGAVAVAALVGPRSALSAVAIDAVLVLVGLMVVAGSVKRSGLAEWLALVSAKMVHGNPTGVLVCASLLTFLWSAFLGPVAAIVLVLPVILLIAVELDVPALPFVTTLSWASLWGGTALATAQPANLWLAQQLGLSLGSWIEWSLPMALLGLVITLATAWMGFRTKLRVTHERKARILEYDAGQTLGNGIAVFKSLTVLVLVIVGLGAVAAGLPLSPSVVALAGATILMLWEGKEGWARALEAVDPVPAVTIGGLSIVVVAFAASGLPLTWTSTIPASGPLVLGIGALGALAMDHQAVLGALGPFLQGWHLFPHLWVWALAGTTLGAGVSVWSSTALVSSHSLAGHGPLAPKTTEIVVWGAIFAVANGVIMTILGLVLGV